MSQGRKKKSVIRTFRIDEDALEIIEKDAQEKKIRGLIDMQPRLTTTENAVSAIF